MLFKSILFPSFITAASAVVINQQPKAPAADFSSSLRDLTWGQLNFLHTTDTHGWLPGHLLEPNFSADWGDLISFVSHMRRRADETGVDLLVVDSGDRHDGNGFSDASIPQAKYTEHLFTQMDYDIITIGNHELYVWANTLQEYNVIRPAFGERYVVSNVDLKINEEWVHLGNKYRRFTTKNQGLKVIGFGFLFDFKGNNPNTRVITSAKAVGEDWFAEALSYNDTDVFVIASHIPVRYFPEMNIIIGAIRAVHPLAVIQFLGGHSHIRDFAVVDERSTAMESGRLLETIGWVSVDNIDTSSDEAQVEFTRTYIDLNLHSLTHHSNTSISADSGNDNFHTPKGLAVSGHIKDVRKQLDLDSTFGCVPRDFLTDRAEFPGKNNLYSLLAEDVLTRLVGAFVPQERSLTHPRYVIINTGSIRFDMFAGPYTRDTAFIISPFPSNWQYIPDVPLKYARKILPELNKYAYILAVGENQSTLDFDYLKNPQQRFPFYSMQTNPYKMFQDVAVSKDSKQSVLADSNAKLTPGYVTCDDHGCDGDDTIHEPWPFHPMPNAIQAEQHIPEDDDEALVDVVFYSFLSSFLKQVMPKIGYENYKFLPYGGPSTVDLLTAHVQDVWSSCK